MKCKIRFKSIHPSYSAPPVPYEPVRVTRGAFFAHRNTYELPRCRISQYRNTSLFLSASLWNDLVHPVFDGVGLAGVKSTQPMFFCLLKLLAPFTVPFPFLFFLSICWYCGPGFFRLIGCSKSSNIMHRATS